MFPLDFPLDILRSQAMPRDVVLDPFSGRGTTNYAARLLGLRSIGIDSNPVAAVLTEAKLANASPENISHVATQILQTTQHEAELPDGEFWHWAFDRDVLEKLCKLREALLADCNSDPRKALRAIILGALHGPIGKRTLSYFSNQCTRTYAPKPRYAVEFWKKRGMRAPLVDVKAVIDKRAEWYYRGQPFADGTVLCGDSRNGDTYGQLHGIGVKWIVTSPPFYGMRTYVPDQWLRNWFIGGPSKVEYKFTGQLEHSSPSIFAEQLGAVWNNVATVSLPDARLVVRYGGIHDRKANPVDILEASFAYSPWEIVKIEAAGSAEAGKRQAGYFARTYRAARPEYDVWTRLR
jgi:hypothetical protein